MMNKQGVIHGDIKPGNIFAKECDGPGIDICPVLGDWDLGYYFERQ